MEKECPICYKTFVCKDKRQKCCSKDCSKKLMSNARIKLFKDGYINPLKGKPLSIEQKNKLSEIIKMKYASGEIKPNLSMLGKVPWNKGKCWSEEVKQKIREKATGRKRSEESKKKQSESSKGRKTIFSEEHRKHITESKLKSFQEGRVIPWNKGIYGYKQPKLMGENNPMWKGGVYPKNRLIRSSGDYTLWRIKVFERDNYTCQKCNARNYKGLGKAINLHPHHIKSFAEYPELRFDLNNGITLCEKCHKEIHSKRLPP